MLSQLKMRLSKKSINSTAKLNKGKFLTEAEARKRLGL